VTALGGDGDYISLPSGLVAGLTGDYTVSAWVNPAANTTWSRVFDFGTGTNDYMFLTVSDGAGHSRPAPRSRGSNRFDFTSTTNWLT
jgi:hypothetical protein